MVNSVSVVDLIGSHLVEAEVHEWLVADHNLLLVMMVATPAAVRLVVEVGDHLYKGRKWNK